MLVYVAELLLDYLVRGPWRDPKGFNFPQTPSFSDSALLSPFFEGGRLHAGALIAVLAIVLATLVFRRTLFGFAINALGEAPRAANFAGFSEKRITFLVFAISGALAGLAGVIEAAGPVGDFGWSYQHDQGRKAIEAAFPGRVETTFVESVPEADSDRAIEQLARTGHRLILTTSFGFMEPTLRVARKYPNVMFEHDNAGFRPSAHGGDRLELRDACADRARCSHGLAAIAELRLRLASGAGVVRIAPHPPLAADGPRDRLWRDLFESPAAGSRGTPADPAGGADAE
jgi:hypothetical protein